ncbi:MAG: DNA polymerase III subunit gamma/tau, partial [Gemmobacter sp.]
PGPRAAAPRPGPGGTAAAPALDGRPLPATFDGVVDLIREKRDIALLIEVERGLRLVRYQPGRIEFEPAPGAAPDLAARLGARLQGWTGARWGLSVVAAGGAPTLAEARAAQDAAALSEAASNPLVQAVLAAFPGARIAAVRSPEARAAEAAAEALPAVEDEWDPFEAG